MLKTGGKEINEKRVLNKKKKAKEIRKK